MSSARSQGFTLLEVLIALAIVALSVGALLGTVTSSASNIIYLRDKTQATWVALNRLTEIRISQDMPDPGKRTGNSEMGGMVWQWEEEVIELPIKGLWRIDVRARPTGQAAKATSTPDKAQRQTTADTSSSGPELENAAWMATVTGVVGASRAQVQTAVAVAFAGNTSAPSANPGNQPGQPGTPGAPNSPTPGSPNSPTPGSPGVPGSPNKPPPSER